MDRIVTVRITTPPDSDYDPVAGSYPDAEPAVAEYERWAERRDVAAETRRVELGGFDYASARRDYMVRWFEELATAPLKHVTVIESGQELAVVNVIEPNESRRRFLVIQCRSLEQ